MPNELWLNVKEVARTLDVSVRTVRAWESSGRIPKAYRRGARWVRWRRSEIEAHLKAMKAG